ncbi:MAG TPA: tripartite tricarboxylate transporter substrate binding protein [Casimicrobiaceae bacterium]|nr:tripartite tricarboxylate transporter substrate binding protein [Casimicrobiaceae bacterium]
MRKTIAMLIGAAMLPMATPAATQAPTYPDRPIRIVVPFPVGGVADTFGREIGGKLTEAWSQPVVVDNRTGAGGNIGADIVAKSAPDGYTLVIGNIGTHAVNVSLLPAMPFDPIKDFTPIVHVLDAEGLLVVNPSIRATTVPELIVLARAQPGTLSYGSAGVGTTSHLAGELFKSMTKVDIVHVPYKGNVPAITDLLGGQTAMIFATMPTVLPHVRAGKLRPLAVLGTARSPALPDVPTAAESVPGFEVSNWIGLFGPAGMPPAIVARLNVEVQKIMRSPEIQKRLESEGAKFIPMTPDQFATFQKAEITKWAKTIKDANIKVD